MKLFIAIIMCAILNSCNSSKKEQFIILNQTYKFTILLDTHSKDIYTIDYNNPYKPIIYKTNLSKTQK